MQIRDEAPGDEAAIHDLTAVAFRPVETSDGSEPSIVDRLRRDGDLSLSLVATDGDGAIVGHAAFSPVAVAGAGGRWFGLGPLSVHPDRQGAGIGSRLLETGLARLKAMNAAGCVLIGNPDWYRRFGFVSDGGLTFGDVPGRYVQWLSFSGAKPQGEIGYSPGFGA